MFEFESSFKMKPSTEILKRELAEKNRIRQKGSRFKEYQNRKRRFKPQNPRFNKSKNPLKGENLVTSSPSEKNLIPDSLIPKSFPKFHKIRTNVDTTDTGIKKTNSSDSLNENFETTNMERNRVVLINSKEDTHKGEESVEKELPPKYLLSTTSRTLSSDEKDFISKPTQKKTGFAQNELLNSDLASYEMKKVEEETNLNEKPFVKLGVSIEEVESATDISKVMNDDTEEIKVNNDNDMADQALYR